MEDNWESPTLGAWGLGWEIWLNGMEVTQFTYFQQVGGLDCRPVMGEITYGLERLAMYLQGVESIYDILWTDGPLGRVTYGDVYHQNEVEQSKYNFELADTAQLFRHFDEHEANCRTLLASGLALPAYEQMLRTSHTFNLLDARKAISVTERQRFILRVRELAKAVARSLLREPRGARLPDAQARRRAERERMAKRDFLFEIGTEELPPKSLFTLAQALADGIAKGLAAAAIAHGEVEWFATPRRLAVRVHGVSDRQPDQEIKRQGPCSRERVRRGRTADQGSGWDSPRRAASVSMSCSRSMGRRVACCMFVGTKKGEPTPCAAAGDRQSGARWSADREAHALGRRRGGVRPARALGQSCCSARAVVDCEILGVRTGKHSRGHRFHAPAAAADREPGEILPALREGATSWRTSHERRERIRSGAVALAESARRSRCHRGGVAR